MENKLIMSNLNHLYAEKQGVLFVDLSQLALSTTMATYERNTKFNLTEVRHMVLATIKHNVLKFKLDNYSRVVICVDNSRSGYWRRQEFDYYKRNRAISRDKKDDFDWDGYFTALNIVVQELKDNMPYHVIDVQFAEADDCIAVLTPHYLAMGWKVKIISSDGDFTQLHTCEDVTQYSPIQKKVVEVKSGSPYEDCLTKIIKGDKKDCVASVKVRGNFYLTKADAVRTPLTRDTFITTLVGKTDAEIHEALRDEFRESYTKADKTKKSGNTKGLALMRSTLIDMYGIDAEKADAIMERGPEFVIDLVGKIRMKRFEENRVLIDFNYIRDDIKNNILVAHDSYVPRPRGDMYPYFVKSGLVKLIGEINNF